MPKINQDEPALITVAAAARRTGVALTTLAAAPPVPIVWIGRRRYFVAEAFEKWLQAVRTNSRAAA